MRRAMIDIETAGTKPGCPILSIGAVTFCDPLETARGNFYARISYDNCLSLGLVPSEATLQFWEEQLVEIRGEAFSGKMQLVDALVEFSDWLRGNNIDEVWCKGIDFDFPILAHAYEICGLEVPWKHNAVRDYRTLAKVMPHIKPLYENTALHNAHADAVHQSMHCEQLLRRID